VWVCVCVCVCVCVKEHLHQTVGCEGCDIFVCTSNKSNKGIKICMAGALKAGALKFVWQGH
jgi:ABC-type molybdate transport system substrate-binding protein